MDERLQQIEAFASLAHIEVETTVSLRTFLPLWRHGRSLGSDVLIVLGARGSGKTALFKLLREVPSPSTLQAFFGNHKIPDAQWLDAFSQDNTNHPDVAVMEAFGRDAGDVALRSFWVAHLLRVAHQQIQGLKPLPSAVQAIVDTPPNNLSTWVPLAETNLGEVWTALDEVEKHLVGQGRTVVALYDYLDRIAQFVPNVRRRYVRSLLSLWLSLTNRYKFLRGKIFLRDDLFQASEIDFTDANKLRGRSETLVWEPESLYRVIVRHVLNLEETHLSNAVRILLQEVPDLQIEDRGEFGLMPLEMANDVYKAFVTRVAGRAIGQGVAKGATHAWILRRLEDAHKRITPRAMMWMFGYAAEAARLRKTSRSKSLLTSSDLLEALRRTSEDRALEVLEEDKIALRLENLRGHQIPFTRSEIVELLKVRREDEEPGIPEDGEAVLDEMVRLGLLREQSKNEIDVPDIYRFGFEIGPDYASAWQDLLDGKEVAARNQFVREAPIMGEILRRLNVAWGDIGEEEVQRGDFAAARERCKRALKGARSTGDKLAEADARRRLGEIEHLHFDNYERAKTELLRALKLVQKVHDPGREMELRWNLGVNEYFLGDLVAAAEQLSKSVDLAKQHGNLVQLSYGYFGLGRVREAEDNRYDALRCYLQSLSYAGRAAESDAEHLDWQALSRLARDMGKFDRAVQFSVLAQEPYNGPTDGLDVEKLRQEALSEYERDKGHALLAKAFPEVDLATLLD